MSKVFKKVHKISKKGATALDPTGTVKKAFKHSDKVFNKVWGNPIGRIAIIAIASYFTFGAAAGWGWTGGAGAGSGAAAANTAVAEGSALSGSAGINAGVAASTGTAAGTGVPTALSTGAATGSTVGGGAAGINAGVAANTGSAVGTGAATTAPAALVPATGSGLSGSMGIIERVRAGASGLSQWVGNNQLVAAMGVNALASGLSEGPYEQQDRLLREKYERNLKDVGKMDIGAGHSGRPLKDSYGNPIYKPEGGLINRHRLNEVG